MFKLCETVQNNDLCALDASKLKLVRRVHKIRVLWETNKLIAFKFEPELKYVDLLNTLSNYLPYYKKLASVICVGGEYQVEMDLESFRLIQSCETMSALANFHTLQKYKTPATPWILHCLCSDLNEIFIVGVNELLKMVSKGCGSVLNKFEDIFRCRLLFKILGKTYSEWYDSGRKNYMYMTDDRFLKAVITMLNGDFCLLSVNLSEEEINLCPLKYLKQNEGGRVKRETNLMMNFYLWIYDQPIKMAYKYFCNVCSANDVLKGLSRKRTYSVLRLDISDSRYKKRKELCACYYERQGDVVACDRECVEIYQSMNDLLQLCLLRKYVSVNNYKDEFERIGEQNMMKTTYVRYHLNNLILERKASSFMPHCFVDDCIFSMNDVLPVVCIKGVELDAIDLTNNIFTT
jgi:hypothetical protein